MSGTVKIERLGGLAGFGLAGGRLHGEGEADLAALSSADQATLAGLFAKAATPPSDAAPHAMRYRITRTTPEGAQTVEAAEQDVPEALIHTIRDRLD